MFKNKRILVVVAHPDDELLGLGATMHKLIKEYNVTAKAIILGEGITSRSDVRDPKLWEEELKIHRGNIEKARQFIGYSEAVPYSLSDNRFDSHALVDIAKVVEKEKEAFQPDIIFTHNGSDLNIDHQMTFQAVMTATRPMEGEVVRTVITCENPSASEWQATSNADHFAPNMYFAVSEEDMQAKKDAMNCYEFESRKFPHPRAGESLDALAKYRGVQVGCDRAEAFQIIRHLL